MRNVVESNDREFQRLTAGIFSSILYYTTTANIRDARVA